MTDYTAYDIVLNAAHQKPLEVDKAVEQIMANKIVDFLEKHRIDVANRLFNKAAEETDEETETISDDEIELDDEDISNPDEETETEDEDA